MTLKDNNSEENNLSIVEKEEFSAEESESSEIDDEFQSGNRGRTFRYTNFP